jgi:acetyl esterase/lipase
MSTVVIINDLIKGAWRSGDKADFLFIAERFVQKGFAIAIINYRLSNVSRYPAPSIDVANAIRFLDSQKIKSILNFEPRFYLIGHSAGAQISGLIALKAVSLHPNTYHKIKGVIGIEGIYDIVFMCDTWPTYAEWFVNDQFTDDRLLWEQGSPISHDPKKSNPNEVIPPHLLFHSSNDELLDVEQTRRYKRHLEKITLVKLDTESLQANHDGVLEEDAFYNLVSDFIQSI